MKDSSTWKLNGDSIDNNKVNSFLGSLSNFRTDDFIDSAVTFSEMQATVKVKSITSSGMEETSLMFFPVAPDSQKYFVRSSATSQVFQVSKFMVNNLLKKKSDLLPTEMKKRREEVKRSATSFYKNPISKNGIGFFILKL